MIDITRDRRAEATDRDAVISLRCDACGRIAPEQGRCDPDDPTAAALLADWLRMRCNWRRAGRKHLCPDCRRSPPRR